jgi:hypothetical protein
MLIGGSGVLCGEMSVAVTSDWFKPRMLILSPKSKGSLFSVEGVWEARITCSARRANDLGGAERPASIAA